MEQEPISNFERYEEDLRVVLGDIEGLIVGIREKNEEGKKRGFGAIERALEEANEIIGQMEIEVLRVPLSLRLQKKTRIQSRMTEINNMRKEFESLCRYEQYREPFVLDQDLESLDQRNRLLSGTRKLEENSERLKNAQRIADETKEIGANILRDLGYQREQIIMTKNTLIEADSYVDKSMRTLKTMARRVTTNKLITYLIIFVLVFLIFAIIWNKLT
ncbi:hypothetical protein T552_00320 [Pneumocystis carinii B80]|uniref:t-SNARE coiled-coil homology domain-containing protein n=1 Tax=Pneumocystis carinii (strain B80) TaxID=1408658 RepID=A0A0W4ZQE7_PNEC8|nr:hypothetical protein T552_00320 [Pneumocystis carinii B80]KTW30603.1 hypothetical protein T552_00320 [Pneumocystis carinii B80]